MEISRGKRGHLAQKRASMCMLCKYCDDVMKSCHELGIMRCRWAAGCRRMTKGGRRQGGNTVLRMLCALSLATMIKAVVSTTE